MKVRKALSLLLLLVLASTLIPSAQAAPPCQIPQEELIKKVLKATAEDLGVSATVTCEQFQRTGTCSIGFADIAAFATEGDAADHWQRVSTHFTEVSPHEGFHGYPTLIGSHWDGTRWWESYSWRVGRFSFYTDRKSWSEVLYANAVKYGLIAEEGAPPTPTPTEAAMPTETPTPIPTATATLTGMPSPTPTETPRPKDAPTKTPSLTTTSPDAAAKGPAEAISDLLSGYSLNVPQSIAQLPGEMPSIGANLGLGADINDPGRIGKTLDWGQKTVSDIYTGIDLVNTIANFTPYGKVVGKVADHIKGAGQPLKDLLDKKKNYNDSLKTLNQDPRFQSMSDDEKKVRAEIMAEIKSAASKALGDAVPSVGSADAIMTGLSLIQPEYSKVTMDHDVGGQEITIDTDFSHWTSGHVINSAVDHGSTSTWNDLAGVVQTQWTDVRDADGVLAKAAHVGKAAAVTTYTTGVAVAKAAVDGASFVADKAHKAWQGLKGLFQ